MLAPQVQQANVPTRLETDLDEYFDALAADSTTNKWVLEELMKYNAALTTTNAKLSASVASLIDSNDQIYCRLGNLRNNNNNRTREDSPAPRPKTLCPHCKIEFMQAPNNCFELDKTLPDALGVGKVVCDKGGHG